MQKAMSVKQAEVPRALVTLFATVLRMLCCSERHDECVLAAGLMKTRKGRLLSPAQWQQSLDRLVQRPERLPFEFYTRFPQVPAAALDKQQLQVRVFLCHSRQCSHRPVGVCADACTNPILCFLPYGPVSRWYNFATRLSMGSDVYRLSGDIAGQDSVERLAMPYVHEKKEEAVRPMWMTHELVMGKLVKKATPWKTSSPEHSLEFCRSLYDRCGSWDCAPWGGTLSCWITNAHSSTLLADASRTRPTSART